MPGLLSWQTRSAVWTGRLRGKKNRPSGKGADDEIPNGSVNHGFWTRDVLLANDTPHALGYVLLTRHGDKRQLDFDGRAFYQCPGGCETSKPNDPTDRSA
jgi:hypothetical protein